jgi:FkbM family methyltransferase
MPLMYWRRRYAEAVSSAGDIAVANGFPGGWLTEEGELYLNVRGLAIYYNVRDPTLTPGDGQSLDVPAGRASTRLEKFVLESVPEDGVYVDVGANNGFFYSLQVARHHADARVFAFEPDPQILPHLERNVDRNGLTNRIEVVAQAVSDTVGQVRLTAGLGASGYLLGKDDPHPGVRVAATSLDAFVAERGLERVDLIKVDIDGHEERMLRGSQRVLLEFRPILVLELFDQHLRRSGSSQARVEQLLSELGYSVHQVAGSNDAVAFPRTFDPEAFPAGLFG